MKDSEVAVKRDEHEGDDGWTYRQYSGEIDKLTRDWSKTTWKPQLPGVQKLHLQKKNMFDKISQGFFFKRIENEKEKRNSSTGIYRYCTLPLA